MSQDERFKISRVKWTFWAISNKMNDYAEADARQRDKPPGLVLDRGNYTIWLKTWNEILDECKADFDSIKKSLNTWHHTKMELNI